MRTQSINRDDADVFLRQFRSDIVNGKLEVFSIGEAAFHKPSAPKEQPVAEEFGTDDERAQLARLETSSPEAPLKRGDLSHPLIVEARATLAKANENPHGILWIAEQCLDIRVSRASLDREMNHGGSRRPNPRGLSVSVGIVLDQRRFSAACIATTA